MPLLVPANLHAPLTGRNPEDDPDEWPVADCAVCGHELDPGDAGAHWRCERPLLGPLPPARPDDPF